MKKFMQKVTKSFHAGEKGFTLIELLIVIVILGVLAAAIIPNLSKFVGSGNKGAANAELAAVRTAISAFQSEDHGAILAGTLPTSATGAAPVTGGAGIVVNSVLAGAGNYITGTIKGVYTVDITGLIASATNGTWPSTISYDGVLQKWK
jgi:type IV pilus assembly protein PilA